LTFALIRNEKVEGSTPFTGTKDTKGQHRKALALFALGDATLKVRCPTKSPPMHLHGRAFA
jgi:hypothetical protein